MRIFLRGILEGKSDVDAKRYFLRFGRGNYSGRFLISFAKTNKIKLKSSFELANEFVKFVDELKSPLFSGKILSKERIAGKEGRKKAGVFVYEVENARLKDYPNAYYYLLNSEGEGFKIRIKGKLPKPGKDEDKIDDSFCLIELDNRYEGEVRETFLWDVPECKKAEISHEIVISDVEIPENVTDPSKIRELARRIGKIVRIANIDGKENKKEYKVSI